VFAAAGVPSTQTAGPIIAYAIPDPPSATPRPPTVD